MSCVPCCRSVFLDPCPSGPGWCLSPTQPSNKISFAQNSSVAPQCSRSVCVYSRIVSHPACACQPEITPFPLHLLFLPESKIPKMTPPSEPESEFSVHWSVPSVHPLLSVPQQLPLEQDSLWPLVCVWSFLSPCRDSDRLRETTK